FAGPLPDDLIGSHEQRLRDGEAESLGSLQVDDQLKFVGLLYRKVAGLRTLEDLIDVAGGVPEHVATVRSIGQKAAHLCVLTQSIHCGQPVSCRKACDTCTVILKHRIDQN